MKPECKICGESRQQVLEQHHLVPTRKGGCDEKENLATLCANCHRCIERLYDKEFWKRASEKILADVDGASVYCTSCSETYDPNEGHVCTAQGEHWVGGRNEQHPNREEQSLSRSAQLELAKSLAENGVPLYKIPAKSEKLTFSKEWYRQRISAENDYNPEEKSA